jgi:outer membrane lipoprotein-sorting protein
LPGARLKSGIKIIMMKTKKLLIVLSLLSLLLPLIEGVSSAGAPETQSISDMLGRLGEKVSGFKTLKTDFVQEKKLAIFKRKIVMKGRIYLQKPGTIAWHVDTPVKYSVLITDKVIRQWDEDTDQVQEIPISKNPVFKIVLNQLTTWFSGNYASLLDEYTVKVLQQRPYIFEFIPKETNFSRKIVKSVTITFREDEKYLQQIKIQEMSGDSTTITFEHTLIDVPIDERFFKVGRRVR